MANPHLAVDVTITIGGERVAEWRVRLLGLVARLLRVPAVARPSSPSPEPDTHG